MPNVSGFDVLEKMNKDKNKTPVIITSNLGQDEDLKRAEKYGAIKYFIKSDISIIEIINFIKEFLKQ